MLRRKLNITSLPIAILILLILFASRVQFLTDTPLHRDEARSAMRMMGTVEEIVLWQPPDWPPLHNVLLGGWATLTSDTAFSLRLFSAWFSLLSVCIAYRMAYQFTKDKRVALGTLVIYGGLGMGVYLGIFIRGYSMVIALLPLAIFFIVRYFESHRWWDAIGLAMTMGVLFLTTYTSGFAFIILGLFTLLLYPKQLWRWLIIGLMASPFALYEFFRKQDYWLSRLQSSGGEKNTVYDIGETFFTHFHEYFGQADIVWLGLVILAIGLWVWKGRGQMRLLAWVVIACVLAPIVTYWLVENRIFVIMTTRYAWWGMVPLAFGLAYGLRYLPQILWSGVMATVLLLTMTLPMLEVYYPFSDQTSFYSESNVEWLSQHIQPDDVLMFDPNFCIEVCRNQDEISYFWDAYLGERLIQVTDPADYRRVWLWRGVGHSRELLDELAETRIPSVFFGPPESLLELYEAPPDVEGVPYENGMRFHGFDIIQADGNFDLPPYNLREHTQFTIRLWWSADEPINEDYQVSLQIHNTRTQTLFVQDDAPPQLIQLKPNEVEPLPATTSGWQPDTFYVDERIIVLPDMTEEIFANLYLVVYRLADGERILAPDVTDDGLRELAETIIWGWG